MAIARNSEKVRANIRPTLNGDDDESLYETLTEEQKNAYGKIMEGKNILIHGQGGSGKSYLINAIRDEKTLCLAPTGMAALNMNDDAKTIHSVLNIGEKSLSAWNWEKVKGHIEKKKPQLKEFFDKYERIVFDEGSMIISGLFNTLINTFHLIYETDSSILFNGKQIIFLMDPLQLTCVKGSSDPFLDMSNQYTNCSSLIESDYIINNPCFKTLFNKELGNIVHFKGNKRCEDEEWNKVLSACRTGFKECSPREKEFYLKKLNDEKRIRMLDCIDANEESSGQTLMDQLFQNLDVFQGGGVDRNNLVRKYEENTKTTLKNNTVQEINNRKIKKLEETELSYTTERKVKISEEDFIQKTKGGREILKKLYKHSINYMDDLGGYYAFKRKEEKRFDLDFKVVKGERVMLRTNQVHPKLKNGSLGEVEDIELDNDGNIIKIMVNFDNLDEIIDIKQITFKHPEISDITIDAFPLIPAFAITIHKLQGQTIKSPLFIDYNDIPWKEKQFHLLYTAISRCKNPEDVYIISDSEITPGHFPVDPVMYQWYCDNK